LCLTGKASYREELPLTGKNCLLQGRTASYREELLGFASYREELAAS
jgi:hypothetical protein